MILLTIDNFRNNIMNEYNTIQYRSVVDSQGYVWNATWRAGEGTAFVDRIDPKTGEVVFVVHLPDETSVSA